MIGLKKRDIKKALKAGAKAGGITGKLFDERHVGNFTPTQRTFSKPKASIGSSHLYDLISIMLRT